MGDENAFINFSYSNGHGKSMTIAVSNTPEDDDKVTSWYGILDEVARALEGFGFTNIRSRLLITGASVHAGKTLKEIYG